MSQTKIKNYFFILLLLLASIESFFQLSLIVSGKPPTRLKSPLFYLNLSPSALVFDRPNGFFRSMDLRLFFHDSTTLEIHYEESELSNKNYLERILKRRIFSNESKIHEKKPYLCNRNSIILMPFQIPNKTILSAEIYSKNDPNFLVKIPCD